jgi:hypothetical protein
MKEMVGGVHTRAEGIGKLHLETARNRPAPAKNQSAMADNLCIHPLQLLTNRNSFVILQLALLEGNIRQANDKIPHEYLTTERYPGKQLARAG